ncbi:hypothetical protein EVAR_39512_1 [Eumeta japonica]|uniref:Uncharacterized protein n=1 Tax=Eumeta variegata TaxID=151549 RepID=A0A4C1W082_EUMVA|nr:hypothetical protein EVAR_39512_1 [Eumeta japonica]
MSGSVVVRMERAHVSTRNVRAPTCLVAATLRSLSHSTVAASGGGGLAIIRNDFVFHAAAVTTSCTRMESGRCRFVITSLLRCLLSESSFQVGGFELASSAPARRESGATERS